MLQAEAAGESDRLHRALGPVHLMLLGVGAIVGAGIFVLTGHAAAQNAGPAIVLSFILAAVACGFAGLCYAEFASMIPIAGSAYTYAYATMGELVAWIIGWDLILEYSFAAGAVAIGWSGYMVSFLHGFGISIPPELTQATGQTVVFFHGHWMKITDELAREILGYDPTVSIWVKFLPAAVMHDINSVMMLQASAILPHKTAMFNLPAIVIIFAATTVLAVGIRESARANAVIVFIKVAVILTFVAVGVFYIQPANWIPFIPDNQGEWGHFGWSGVFRGAATIFFAYIGFDAISTAAQEAKNPQRDMPIGILGSLAICTVLYIAVAGILTGIVPYRLLNVPEPIALGIDMTGNRWLAPFIKIGAIAGLSSVIIVMLMGQSRVFYSMSQDRLLPAVFSSVHPRFKTPFVTTLGTGAVVALIAALTPIDDVAYLVNIGTLFAFVIVCGGVLVLRYRHPEIHRHFRVPAVHFVCIGGILSCLYLMSSLPAGAWVRLFLWMAAGTVIFFAYSRRKSRLNS